MKDLYKPVFWCGFALSLSALYASAEKLAADAVGTSQKPVLMQISVGESVSSPDDSQPSEKITKPEIDFNSPSQPFINSTDGIAPPLLRKKSAFYEAAKAAMEAQ